MPESNPKEVTISGAVTGSDLAFKNNYFRAHCIKMQGSCEIVSFDQIGSKLIGSPDFDSWPITEWSQDYVVARAADPENTSYCSFVTLHINLHSQEVLYNVDPVPRNISDQKLCPSEIHLKHSGEV